MDMCLLRVIEMPSIPRVFFPVEAWRSGGTVWGYWDIVGTNLPFVCLSSLIFKTDVCSQKCHSRGLLLT